MIPLRVKRCKIFSEFTPEEQEKYFSLKDKCVRSHIDTLYYFVKIAGDQDENKHPGMIKLLQDLARLKASKKADYEAVTDFHGLSVEVSGFSVYEFHLSLPDMFDIYISSYLPNQDTPRVLIQLRTRSLVLLGPYQSVADSLGYVLNILVDYGLSVGDVDVNRVDYAWHTNIIQNPMKYFSDDILECSLCSKLRTYMKVGRIGSEVTLETLSLGKRQSNNVFFRAYNKTVEVIQKGYKSFFIHRWLEQGLISEYDYYVLMYAYEHNSFVAGVHCGRLAWYIEYGKDEKKKERCRDLISKYHVISDNNKALKLELDGYYDVMPEDEKMIDAFMPPVTVVMNIEFQTKRKFYNEIRDTLQSVQWENPPNPMLEKVFAVIALRASIQRYLTSKTVSFCHPVRKKDRIPLDWWRRIQCCKIDGEADHGSLVRKRDLQAEISKIENRLKNSFAHYCVLREASKGVEISPDRGRSFFEDASDIVATLNDNDKNYNSIFKRKARQDRGLIRSLQCRAENENKKMQEFLSDFYEMKISEVKDDGG